MGTQKLAADLEEWLLFTIFSRLHWTLTLFYGYSLRCCWFWFSLKVLLIPLGRLGPHGECQPAILPGPGLSILQGSEYHDCSADSTYSSSCSAPFKNGRKLLWRPQSTWTCILRKKKKKGLMQKCWLLGTKYLWHHVSEKHQHTKLIWNDFIFSSTYVFLFPVC